MKNGTDKYIGTVAYLGKMYDYVNEMLFNGELNKPVITVQRDERNRSLGWWSVNETWFEGKEDKGEHELNITAQCLNRTTDEIFSTLIHEMCHQYASVHNMQDCSRSGTYHNKLFKKIAETHGLKVDCDSKNGWSYTTLNDDTKLFIGKWIQANPEKVIYRAPVLKGGTVKTSSTRKYVCPICGSSVRATKEVNIMCMDCNECMQCED